MTRTVAFWPKVIDQTRSGGGDDNNNNNNNSRLCINSSNIVVGDVGNIGSSSKNENVDNVNSTGNDENCGQRDSNDGTKKIIIIWRRTEDFLIHKHNSSGGRQQ